MDITSNVKEGNARKKIVILGSAHPLRGGGIATFNERLAKAFMQEGHEVQIISFSLQYPNFLFPGTSQYTTEPAPADLIIHSLINSINPFNWFKVGNQIKKMQPDLVVVRYWLPFMGPCLGTILRRIKKNKTTQIVCIADNIIPHEPKLGDQVFTRYFVKPVDSFITMSEKVKEDLLVFAPNFFEFRLTAYSYYLIESYTFFLLLLWPYFFPLFLLFQFLVPDFATAI